MKIWLQLVTHSLLIHTVVTYHMLNFYLEQIFKKVGWLQVLGPVMEFF